MKKMSFFVLALITVSMLAGCHSDIVCTERVKHLKRKCVYIEPLKTENPHIGQVLSDVLLKEFVRRHFETCDPDNATIVVSGAAFLTRRSEANTGIMGASADSNQAIESVSLTVRNSKGQLLASASYDNKKRYTASKLGKELGSALAGKLK